MTICRDDSLKVVLRNDPLDPQIYVGFRMGKAFEIKLGLVIEYQLLPEEFYQNRDGDALNKDISRRLFRS